MKYYKIIALGLALFLSVQTGWAQSDKKQQRKIERAEKKRLKEEARLKKQEEVKELVKEQSYVLEAFTLAGRYNQRQVNPNTNFVKVEGDRLIVQTGNDFRIGYNGLGGITISGIIRDYRVTEDKNGVNVLIQFSDPVLGFSTLMLDVGGNGFARASVLDSWGGRAIFQGQLVAPEESRVFKGQPII